MARLVTIVLEQKSRYDIEEQVGMFDSFFQPVTRSQFARLIARSLRQVGDKRTSHYSADSFQLHFKQDGKEVGVANLHNIYDEYSHRSGRDRKEYLKQAVRTLLSPYKKLPVEFADAQPDLLLTVRERSYFTLLESRQWTSGNNDFVWPHLPLGQHLAVGLVYDLPEAMVMLQQKQLDEWGVSFYEVYEAAFANLVESEATFSTFDDRLYVADTQDNYDASRVLMTDWIRSLSVEGNPVVMIPNRDKLLITGSEDERGLQMMVGTARDILELPRPMTGMAFELEGDEWSPWLPPQEFTSYRRFLQLKSKAMTEIYNQQKMIFDAVPESSDAMPRCGEITSTLCEDANEFVTFCVWPEGEKLLLPQADYVCFQSSRLIGPPLYGRWDRVVEIVGDLMRQEGNMYPDRYRVDAFPTVEQRSKLRCDVELSPKGMMNR